MQTLSNGGLSQTELNVTGQHDWLGTLHVQRLYIGLDNAYVYILNLSLHQPIPH